MGVNNRARRAAKKRQRATRRPEAAFAGSAARDQDGGTWPFDSSAGPGPSDREIAELVVAQAVERCEGDAEVAAQLAGDILASNRLSADDVGAAMQHLLRGAVEVAVEGGWGPRDLSELVRRRLSRSHQPLLAGVLHAVTSAHKADRVAPQWRDELGSIGTRQHPGLHTQQGLALALALACTVLAAPRVPPLMPRPGAADPLANLRVTPGGQDAKVLAKVRALLAKAESTEFPEEAEALSSKAQELISRHSLDRLIAAAGPHAGGDRDSVTIVARRLWLDAPYVSAKGTLVAEVAAANRCSTVMAIYLGFTTVAGTASDIDAVEVLVTSLMVQADVAMLAAGRGTREYGQARSAAYRRAFLLSFGHRIGERLREADRSASAVVAESSGGGALVPVVKEHGERVDAALAEMFPNVVYKKTTIGNMAGWVEGRAAADRARLDGTRSIGG